MPRESIDPAYWRKKAAEFRWLAHCAAPRESQILTRRAAEFAAMAALLQGQEAPVAAASPALPTGRWVMLAACVAGVVAAAAAICLDRSRPDAIAAAQPHAIPSGAATAPVSGGVRARPPVPAPAGDGTPGAKAAPVKRAAAPPNVVLATIAPQAAAAELALPQTAPPPPRFAPRGRMARTRLRRSVRRARHHEVGRTVLIFGYRLKVTAPKLYQRPIP